MIAKKLDFRKLKYAAAFGVIVFLFLSYYLSRVLYKESSGMGAHILGVLGGGLGMGIVGRLDMEEHRFSRTDQEWMFGGSGNLVGAMFPLLFGLYYFRDSRGGWNKGITSMLKAIFVVAFGLGAALLSSKIWGT